ncbi:cupredoxin domain-containing protein [Candidatus Uhrbacteria bacterium]|nr:cupredoxin domain-containing protein [Candidatus Uhrbacteria bacterium]
MRRILASSLLAALMGAGCAANPAPIPTNTNTTPVPNAIEPSSPSAVETTPTPVAPKPATATAPKPTPKPVTKTITVEIKDNAFSPQMIAVNAGDTVVWKNVGKGTHTVHSSSGVLWDSGSLLSGATYRRTFSATGKYDYYCANHSGMSGSVIVGEVRPQ